MKIARPLLLPFSPLYGLVVLVRNFLFDIKLFRSKRYPLPIIAVGNLSAGGTGKTPHTEYVARFSSKQLGKRTAILSRGYGRISSGIQVADHTSLPMIVGDEPAQLKKQLPQCHVVVDGNRRNAIETMQRWPEPPELIVMDDGFQHRKVKAGHYVLLTAFDALFYADLLLPGGNLRESARGARRAQTVIVTKCPEDLSEQQQQAISKRVARYTKANVYFTSIRYQQPVVQYNAFDFDAPFLLVTGIANYQPLLDYLNKGNKQFVHMPFPDHHDFTEQDLEQILERAKTTGNQLLTTEKDIQRFSDNFFRDDHLNAAYLPITISFLAGENDFKATLTDFVNQY